MSNFLFKKYRCVLIHIPKTGGASIRNGFFKGEYEGPALGMIPEEWEPCFKFCFVRNPFDRLVSAWKMFTSGMSNTKWEFPGDAKPETGLRQFMDIVMDESIPYDSKKRERWDVKIRHHAIPQTHPFNCLHLADFVGRFENLRADFKKICDRLGIEGELPHWNKTDHESYQKYFDAETRSLAEQYFAEDLKVLDYQF